MFVMRVFAQNTAGHGAAFHALCTAEEATYFAKPARRRGVGRWGGGSRLVVGERWCFEEHVELRICRQGWNVLLVFILFVKA